MAIQINAQATRSIPHIHLVVAEGRGAEELFLQFHLTAVVKETRHALDTLGLLQPEFHEALPYIALIKAKDVIAREHVKALVHNPFKPGEQEIRFGVKGMDFGSRNRGATAEDEDMLCDYRARDSHGANLDNRISGNRSYSSKRLIQQFSKGSLLGTASGPDLGQAFQSLGSVHTLRNLLGQGHGLLEGRDLDRALRIGSQGRERSETFLQGGRHEPGLRQTSELFSHPAITLLRHGELLIVGVALNIPESVLERRRYHSGRGGRRRDVIPQSSQSRLCLKAVDGDPTTWLNVADVEEAEHGVNVGLVYLEELLRILVTEFWLLICVQENLSQVVKHAEAWHADLEKGEEFTTGVANELLLAHELKLVFSLVTRLRLVAN